MAETPPACVSSSTANSDELCVAPGHLWSLEVRLAWSSRLFEGSGALSCTRSAPISSVGPSPALQEVTAVLCFLRGRDLEISATVPQPGLSLSLPGTTPISLDPSS